MQTIPTALTALLLAAGVVLTGATTASAGGTTSVLLSSPSTGSTALLHRASSLHFRILEEKLVDVEATVDRPRRGAGRQLTATWLIHDVMVGRVDTIHVATDGAVVVSSSSLTRDGTIDHPAAVSWGRVRDPEAVVRILDRLGLTTGQPSTGDAATARPQPAEPEAAESRPEPQAAAPAWRWGMGGVVLGIALTLVSRRLVQRRRAEAEDTAERDAGRDRGPLVDVLG